MGKLYDEITPDLAAWLGEQCLFFVATAPLSADGLVNCSPKGMDTFRILGPREVAYLDLTRENGRVVLMFCAFAGAPKIVRLHGEGEVIDATTPDFEQLRSQFPDFTGARAIIRVRLTRIGDSCGYAVPRLDFVEHRDSLVKWAESKGPESLVEYRRQKNARSLDELPGLEPHD
jgi:pyridoxamine 5'-phosphate oxidase-like protein